MRVLVVGPLSPPYGGPEKITETLLASPLFRQSFDVYHVNIQKPLTNEQRSRFNFINLAYNGWHLLSMIRAVIRYRPRVVFLFLAQNKIAFFRDAVFIATAKMLGRRVIASREGAYFKTFYERSSPFWRWLIRRTLALPDRIRLESELIRSQLEGLVHPNKLVVCRAGIDAFAFNGAGAKRGESEKLRILFVGNISVAKGAVDLVRAATVLQEKWPGTFEFRLVGDFLNNEQNITGLDQRDNAHTQIRDLIVRNKLEDKVIFTGPKYGQDKIEEFTRADIFALPSYSEGVSNAMLEALAAGLPIVATNVGALPEGVIDGVNGFLVQAGDWKSFGERLTMLASDRALRNKMGVAGRELCETKFTVESFVACLSKLISVAAE